MNKKTYTVMWDKGEDIDGRNIRPYETFQSVPTPELEEKVRKGYLIEGTLTPAQKQVIMGNEQGTVAPVAKRRSKKEKS